MTNEEKILELLQQMHDDISAIKDRLEAIEEGQEEVRTAVNVLIEWSENAGYIIKYPFAQ